MRSAKLTSPTFWNELLNARLSKFSVCSWCIVQGKHSQTLTLLAHKWTSQMAIKCFTHESKKKNRTEPNRTKQCQNIPIRIYFCCNNTLEPMPITHLEKLTGSCIGYLLRLLHKTHTNLVLASQKRSKTKSAYTISLEDFSNKISASP